MKHGNETKAPLQVCSMNWLWLRAIITKYQLLALILALINSSSGKPVELRLTPNVNACIFMHGSNLFTLRGMQVLNLERSLPL